MSEVKIQSGYCYETDAVEPADFAVQKRDAEGQRHHYFCVSHDCAFPLFPAHWHDTGVAWFRGDAVNNDHNHVISCHYREQGSAGGSIRKEIAKYQPDNKRRVIVPNFLGDADAQQIKSWPNNAPPTREQIAALAAQAKRVKIAGDLEEVVSAHEKVKGERSEYPLNINGREANYSSAFAWLWDMQQPWNPQEWDQNIVTAYCKIKTGTQRDGIWFINVMPSSKGKFAESRLKIGITIREEQLARDSKKQEYKSLLETAVTENKAVKLYWHGLAPTRSDTGLCLTSPRPVVSRFALRLL